MESSDVVVVTSMFHLQKLRRMVQLRCQHLQAIWHYAKYLNDLSSYYTCVCTCTLEEELKLKLSRSERLKRNLMTNDYIQYIDIYIESTCTSTYIKYIHMCT